MDEDGNGMSTPPNFSDDETTRLDHTRHSPVPEQPLPPLPPPPPGERGHVRQHLPERRGRGREKRGTAELRSPTSEIPPPPGVERPARLRQRERRKSDSGLFLPAWSVALMLVVVFAIAGGVVLLVLSLGGRPAEGGQPRVVIITAVPSDTPVGGAQDAEPTLPFSVQLDDSPQPTFALEGPLLPTAVLTPTPVRISVGSTVEVINVGASKLNLRRGAGTANPIVLQVNEGDRFLVIGGPETTENLTWWQLQNLTNSSISGWAVENDGEQQVLQVVAAE